MKTFMWLLRRETWEHRAFWITPVIVSSILLLMTLVAVVAMVSASGDENMNIIIGGLDLQSLESGDLSALLYSHTWTMFMPFAISLIIMLMFYCLDTLYGDRRDRSIMFWKSLPVSDSATVLSKLCTAVLVAPAITFVFFVGLHLLTLLIMSIGGSIVGIHNWFWLTHPGQLFLAWVSSANKLLLCSLLLLPVYGWFLLASAWARKAPFLWAVAPPLLVMWLEWMIFDTGKFATVIGNQFAGVFAIGIAAGGDDKIIVAGDVSDVAEMFDVVWFWEVLAEPAFWGGAVVTALFVGTAIWLRRWRNED